MKLDALKQAVLVWGPLSQEAVQRLKAENSLVLVAENRPSLIGLKHNVPLLTKKKIDFVYCPDNALGLLFYKQKIKKTLISCSSGSLYAALLSKIHNVPLEAIDQGPVTFKDLDRNASTLEGKDFILEVDKEEYIIEPDDESIDKEVLK